jgi:hypothetical protein
MQGLARNRAGQQRLRTLSSIIDMIKYFIYIFHSLDFIGNLFFDFSNLLLLYKSKAGFQ